MLAKKNGLHLVFKIHGSRTKRDNARQKFAGRCHVFITEMLKATYAGINPVIRINTNNPKMAYNSGNTANTIVVPNTL